MLQFWKKNGKKGKSDSRSSSISTPQVPKSTISSLPNGSANCLDGPHNVGPLSGINWEEFTNIGDGKWVSCKRSQLSKTLREVLVHKGALNYFVKYLEARNVQALIKFWLEAESFRVTAMTKPSGLQAQAVSITQEELERLNDAPRSSPQHSQRSLGTDYDSTHESPSHSTNSGGHVADISFPSSVDSATPNFPLQKSLVIPTKSNERLISDEYDSKSTFVIEGDDQVKSDIGKSDIGSIVRKCDVSPDNIRTGVQLNSSQGNKVIKSVLSEDVSNPLTVPTLLKSDDSLQVTRQSFSFRSSVSSPARSCSNFQQAIMNDAVRIYRKYLAMSCVYKIPFETAARERIVQAICKEDGIVDAATFSEAQEIVFHIMNNEHFNSFLLSDFHCKHQIDVLTSGRVTMADILYNETALFYFTEFMEQEGNTSLVQFWLAAVNFQQHLLSQEGDYDATVAQNDAMILYDKYFSMQATCPLGFNDQVRLEVEQNICREEGPLPDCFQRSIDIVQYLLERSYLSSFLSSQLNMKYLTELVNTIQSSPALITRHRKTASESSSEWSISAQNTLLAAEDGNTHPNKALRKVTAGEMCIDSRQLNDPDALWRRHRHNGLNFGRINHMGRFETDVEPEPDRKEESRLAKAVKKLVNMEEDKAKEEMAWQIAEMIVKDITSLTLGNSASVKQS